MTARTGKALIDATRPYAVEKPLLTAWHLLSTFAVITALLAVCAGLVPLVWPLRLLLSVVAGFAIVRGFILYHDMMHNSILRGRNPLAVLGRGLLKIYGVLTLTPPTVWRQTHNYHHAHTSKIVGSHIGSFPVLTVDMYKSATPLERVLYRVVRHPLSMLFGYATLFIYGMCIQPLFRNPRLNWDCGLALVVHSALTAALVHYTGVQVYLFAFLVPLMVAFATGAYLFYAQHNFPDVEIQPRDQWDYTKAALHCSSYIGHRSVVGWFTGNIGFHHVHHLNALIPFYRLPEAMAAVPELQHPHTTSLWPADVAACLRLKLWDASAGRMVGYAAARSRN